MTISSTTRKAGPFLGNGVATVFPFAFKVFDKTDVKLLRVDPNGISTLLTLDSDYSVSLNADQDKNPGGSLTYPITGSPLSTGYSLIVLGDLPYEQPTDITNSGGFYPEVIEDMLDRATIQIQQLAEAQSRAIAVAEVETAPPTLPSAAERANTVLGFDELGNATMLPVPSALGAGDMHTDVFVAGTDFVAGATATLNLSKPYGAIDNIAVHFDGAYQGKDQILSLIGVALSFNAPIPVGTQRVYVTGGTTISLYSPPDGSVTDAKVSQGSRLYNRIHSLVYLDDYGAVGDGLVDDSAAVMLADAAAGPGGVVICTKAAYKISTANLGTSDRIYHMYNNGAFTGAGASTFKGNFLTFPNYGISVGRSLDWRVANSKGSALTIGEYVAVQQDDPGATATLRVFPGKAVPSPTQIAIEPYWSSSVNDLHSVGNGEDIGSFLVGKLPEADGSEERGGWVYKEWVAGTRYRHHQICSLATFTGAARDIHTVLGGKRLQMWDAANLKTVFDCSDVLGSTSKGNTVADFKNAANAAALRISAQASNGPVAISHLTNGTEDCRATWDVLGVSIGAGAGYSPGAKIDTTASDTTSSAALFQGTNAAYVGELLKTSSTRAANSAFSFFTGRANNVRQFNLRGDGNGFAAGAWTGGGADYAEYFEWADGNPNAEDRVGLSVMLDGNKIRAAAAGEDPFGVVSATAVVVGDAAWDAWAGRYVRDDLGRIKTQPVDVVSWDELVPAQVETRHMVEDVPVVGDDGKPSTVKREYDQTVELEAAHVAHRSYPVNAIPDGVTVPDTAVRETVQEPVFAADYDPTKPYVPRESRPEWSPIGLMGKLRLRKGQPTGSRWIKLRDISDDVEEWLVR